MRACQGVNPPHENLPHQNPPFYFTEPVRFVDQLTLAAVGSAVSCARAFLKLTLAKWLAAALEDDALVILSELATNAVNATGTLADRPTWAELDGLDLIHVRLLGLKDSIVIEVADASPEVPAVRAFDLDAEGGRGLHLVQGLSRRWDFYRTTGGKVTWAEVPVPVTTVPARPARR